MALKTVWADHHLDFALQRVTSDHLNLGETERDDRCCVVLSQNHVEKWLVLFEESQHRVQENCFLVSMNMEEDSCGP